MSPGDILIPLATFAGGYGGSWLLRPKALAEASQADAQARTLDWKRFQGEIDRLDLKIAAQAREIADQAKEIGNLKDDRDERAKVSDKRERENRILRAKVAQLEKRIASFEELFRVHPVPPEMQAELDKLGLR